MTFGCGNDARTRRRARERLGAGDARWESLVDVLLVVLSSRPRRRSVRTARDDDARGRFTAPARDRIRVTRATDRPRHRVEMTMRGWDAS
jgi:hypothetical protein